MPLPSIQRIAIIGFGEAGGIFGRDFAQRKLEVSVFDILFASKRHRAQMLSKARQCGVTAAEDLRACVRDAQLVISAVTTTSDLSVAKQAAPLLRGGQIFLDINSVSPETKRKAARCIEPGAKKNRAHYVEAAVMAAVPGPRLKVPMLLGGKHGAEAAERLTSIGMNAAPFSTEIGIASAVKMCRSVMIKGFEALALECLLAARQFDAEDAVLESLAATYPSLGWKDGLPDYLISRVAEHGQRRADEMRQVAQALRSVGIKPTMALATAERQERLIREMDARDLSFDAANPFSWRALADSLRRERGGRSKKKSV